MTEKSLNFQTVFSKQHSMGNMVRKVQEFFVTQILREIKFGEYSSSKPAFFAILGALEFFTLQKFLKKSRFRASKCVQISYFESLDDIKSIYFPHLEWVHRFFFSN